MKNSKKLIQALVLAAVLLCGICIGAGASGTAQKVTASLDAGVTVTFDGVTQEFFDASGNRVYPILYNGSTYLPMRAVCEQLAGFKVGWNQSTRTASITSKSADGVDLLDDYKAYFLTNEYQRVATQSQTADKQSKDISGITCSHWLELHLGQYAVKNDTVNGSFNVDGQYDTVTFQYYSNNDIILRVIGDNDTVLFERSVPGGQVAQTVTVNLLKSSQLTFQAEKQIESGGGVAGRTSAYIFNARLK